MAWFWKKPKIESPCQCGHMRCYHTEGRMGCHYGIIGKSFTGEDAYGECPCAHYIPSGKPTAEQEVMALEKMLK